MSMNILRATKLKYGAIHSAEPKQMCLPDPKPNRSEWRVKKSLKTLFLLKFFILFGKNPDFEESFQ